MFGILSSMMHTATRTEPFTMEEHHRERLLHERRKEEARREREALDELIRYRRGYW